MACRLLLGLLGVVLIGFGQMARAQDRPIVHVNTVDQLYAAVNEPANADALIVLAPGIYTLSSTAPNGGTLLLQPHTGLVGYNEYQDVDGDGVWDEVDWPAEHRVPVTRALARPKTDTIIDGTPLTINAGVIRVGRLDGQQEADNSVSRLTIKGGLPAGTDAGGAEVSARALPLGSSIRVTDCVLETGQRGIYLVSVLNNVTSHLVAERNILRDHDLTPQTTGSSRGWGIHLDPEGSNGIALSNVSLTAHLRHNRFYNNRIGLHIVHVGMDDSDNTVVSHSNIYDSQIQSSGGFPGIGTGIFTHISSASADTHRNRAKLISINDTIVNNVGNGGVFAFFEAPSGNVLEDNDISLSLVGATFANLNAAGGLEGDQNRTTMGKRADVTLDELAPNSTSGPNISGNRMTILLRDTLTSFAPISTDSHPKPFVITDRTDVTSDQVSIRVIESDVRFRRTTSGSN
jgi:hypothetical protein